MTPKQRDGDWNGFYTDSDNKNWKWECLGSRPPEPSPEPEIKKVIVDRIVTPTGKFSKNVQDTQWFKTAMDIAYYPAFGWILGWLTELSVGLPVYSWITLEALIEMGECADEQDWDAWYMGPARRVVFGWGIFFFNFLMTAIPGVNFAVPFYAINWSVKDYMDYNTEIVPKKKPAE